MTSIPRSSAIAGRVDEVDRLLGVAAERMPTSGEIPSRRVSWSASAAADLDLDPVDRAVAEPGGEPAELLAERDERRQRLHRLRPDGGDVDGVGDDAAGQRGDAPARR